MFAAAAVEIPYDGIDQDGDGRDLTDRDGDGYASTLAFGPDCNDRDGAVHPGRLDWITDGVDANCDGLDGYIDLGGSWVLVTVLACALLGLVTVRRGTR